MKMARGVASAKMSATVQYRLHQAGHSGIAALVATPASRPRGHPANAPPTHSHEVGAALNHGGAQRICRQALVRCEEDRNVRTAGEGAC